MSVFNLRCFPALHWSTPIGQFVIFFLISDSTQGHRNHLAVPEASHQDPKFLAEETLQSVRIFLTGSQAAMGKKNRGGAP